MDPDRIITGDIMFGCQQKTVGEIRDINKKKFSDMTLMELDFVASLWAVEWEEEENWE